MTDLAARAESWLSSAREEWETLVDIAIALRGDQLVEAAKRLANKSGKGRKTILRKMEAIRFKATQGWPAENIKRAGQEDTLSTYVKTKVRERTEPLVAFPHRLTPGVRALVQELCFRTARVLRLKSKKGNISYDNVFESIYAHFAIMSDEEFEAALTGIEHAPHESTAPGKMDRHSPGHSNSMLA